MNRWYATLLAALLGLGLVVAVPVAASAHTDLAGSTPAEDAVVDRAVTSVRLTFASALNPDLGDAVVVGDDGNRAVGQTTVRGRVLTVPVQPLDRAGRYEVSYRVVSVDGHPVTGHYRFEISEAGARAAQALESSSGAGPAAGGVPSPAAAGAEPDVVISAPGVAADAAAQLGGADVGVAWRELAPELALVALAMLIFGASLGHRSRLVRKEVPRG
ncbi:MAG TPA: copper resistance CopC family protein [Nocardioidaceae bacterium]|nr:copper resistance CopC family protein [Nocardioidaceae bacterium]